MFLGVFLCVFLVFFVGIGGIGFLVELFFFLGGAMVESSFFQEKDGI